MNFTRRAHRLPQDNIGSSFSVAGNRPSIVPTCTDGIRVLTAPDRPHHRPPTPQGPDADDDGTVLRSVLHFSAVTFMGSSGINALVAAYKAAQSAFEGRLTPTDN